MSDALFIAGEWREGSGQRFESTDPATGEAVWAGPAATPEEVSEAVEAARSAFTDWSEAPREFRVEKLRAYQAELKARHAG